MSAVGYNGRDLIIELDGTPLAAISSKSINLVRTGVEVPTDDDSGWMRILPRPGRREINATFEGVVTVNNLSLITDEWQGNVFTAAAIRLPDGRLMTASDGFFMGDIEVSGEEDGHVAFSGNIRSSGVVTIAAA